MVDASSNIDDSLGVRNLVKSSQQQQAVSRQKDPNVASSAAPLKSRQNLDHWSTNNGSVIYAQSELVKNHLSAQHSKPTSSSSESQQHKSNKMSGQATHHSLSKYIRADQANGVTKSSANNADYQTLRPAKYNKRRSYQPDPKATSTTNGDGADQAISSETPTTNWSDGSGATSDLLF